MFVFPRHQGSIRFCKIGNTTTAIYKMLQTGYRKEGVSSAYVLKWFTAS